MHKTLRRLFGWEPSDQSDHTSNCKIAEVREAVKFDMQKITSARDNLLRSRQRLCITLDGLDSCSLKSPSVEKPNG